MVSEEEVPRELAVRLSGELGAQGLQFLAADGPGDSAPHAVSVDARAAVQKLQQRAPGIAILQPLVAAFWAARQEGNVGVHGKCSCGGSLRRARGPTCRVTVYVIVGPILRRGPDVQLCGVELIYNEAIGA